MSYKGLQRKLAFLFSPEARFANGLVFLIDAGLIAA